MKQPKYQDVNPLSKLHEGEPFFFLRAQDRLSSDTVIAYSKLLQIESNSAAQRGEDDLALSLANDACRVMCFAHKFLDWQQANPDKVKLPD